jgi:hypothetical protein
MPGRPHDLSGLSLVALFTVCLVSSSTTAAEQSADAPKNLRLQNHIITEQFQQEVICNTSDYEYMHHNLHIDFVNKTPAFFDSIQPWYGPDGKRNMKIHEPDTTKNGPRTLQIYIPRPNQSALLVTVENFSDAGGAYWTSLSRIVIPVFWGTIAETEFTIDVDNGKIIVARDINYGAATMSKEEACPDTK